MLNKKCRIWNHLWIWFFAWNFSSKWPCSILEIAKVFQLNSDARNLSITSDFRELAHEVFCGSPSMYSILYVQLVEFYNNYFSAWLCWWVWTNHCLFVKTRDHLINLKLLWAVHYTLLICYNANGWSISILAQCQWACYFSLSLTVTPYYVNSVAIGLCRVTDRLLLATFLQ